MPNLTAESRTTEILLNNSVEEDIQSIFRPLNFIQNIYCTPKYRIKDNFITPNGIYENIISLSGVVVFLVVCMCNIALSSCPIKIDSAGVLLCLSDVFNVTVSVVGFIINFWVSVTQSNNNVQLLLRLQTSYRLMDYSKRDVNVLKINLWLKVVLLYLCSFSLYIYFHIILRLSPIRNVIFDVIVLCFDMNMVYATSMMKLIVNCLICWHKEIKKPENIIRYKNVFALCEDRMFYLYMNLMLAYKLFKKAFQHLILFHTFGTFLHVLIYVQITIEVGKTDWNLIIHSAFMIPLILSTWLLKNVILQVLLGIQSEKFYTHVHNIDTTCIMAIATSKYSDRRRKFYKNIRRFNQTTFKKLDACGLFTVDAGSMIRLFGCIATYTIVLLQFAYL